MIQIEKNFVTNLTLFGDYCDFYTDSTYDSCAACLVKHLFSLQTSNFKQSSHKVFISQFWGS